MGANTPGTGADEQPSRNIDVGPWLGRPSASLAAVRSCEHLFATTNDGDEDPQDAPDSEPWVMRRKVSPIAFGTELAADASNDPGVRERIPP